jgi:hypothetical protein
VVCHRDGPSARSTTRHATATSDIRTKPMA